MSKPEQQIADLRAALAALLDAMDYTSGNCRPNEQVGAVVPKILILNARLILSIT